MMTYSLITLTSVILLNIGYHTKHFGWSYLNILRLSILKHPCEEVLPFAIRRKLPCQ